MLQDLVSHLHRKKIPCPQAVLQMWRCCTCALGSLLLDLEAEKKNIFDRKASVM